MDNVRNPEGIWINTKLFSESATTFQKTKTYCSAPTGSPEWREFWTQERTRCIEGYTVGGASITGDHYFYLNYYPIQRVDEEIMRRAALTRGLLVSDQGKIRGFPDFWDGDYNYFWMREIARRGILSASKLSLSEIQKIMLWDYEPEECTEEMIKERDKIIFGYYDRLGLYYKIKDVENLLGGWDLIIGKARRKGYSYKNSSVGLNNYLHRTGTYTMYMAYDKKYLYPKGIFSMSINGLSFINEHTAWTAPSDFLMKQDHIRNSYKKYKPDGRAIETGMMSEIQAISFKDNPSAGRGKDAYDIFGEEVGAWGTPGGLHETVAAMRPSTYAGSIKTGLITLFGTSGDMSGGTFDFAEIHRKPNANGFLEVYDVWGPHKERTEGIFHPAHLNREGFYDEHGNSNTEAAKKNILNLRKRDIENNISSDKLQLKIQEDPLNSAEAFALTSVNNFPVVELQQRLDMMDAERFTEKKAMPVELYWAEGNEVRYKHILDGSALPIHSYTDSPTSKRGEVVMYEGPIPDAEPGLYSVAYDPVRQDEGTSLACILVHKKTYVGNKGGYKNNIVCEFFGRREFAEDHDEICAMLCMLYGAKVMHENEVPDTKNWFRRKRLLHLLAYQPDAVISKNVKSSRVNRVYGCHMTTQLKSAGERYIKSWLLEVIDHDEEGTKIRVLDQLPSRRLIEELIKYNREYNFDGVSALIMLMIMMQEEMETRPYEDKTKETKLDRFAKLFTRNY